MGFAFSIKNIKPLVNEETRNKAIVKFRWSKFENHILKKASFVIIVFITASKAYYDLFVETDELQFFSLLLKI